jgi:hypothetical protein
MATLDTPLKYSWTLNSITVQNQDPLQNVIIQTTWTLTGSDEANNTGSFSGATPLSAPDANTFIPFNQVSEELVLKWVSDGVFSHNTYVQHINEQIINQINLIKYAKITIDPNNFPWANT